MAIYSKKNIISFIVIVAVFQSSITVVAQSWYRPTNSLHELWYNNYDLQERKLHNKQHFASLTPDSIETKYSKHRRSDSNPAFVKETKFINHLRTDSKPVFVKDRKLPFYESEGQFYYEEGKDYQIFLNPILHLGMGTAGSKQTLLNTRGVEFKGNLGGKYGLGFSSRITENQWTGPAFVDSFKNRNDVIPGQIWWKNYKNKGYDYIDARGYITFTPIKNFVTAQFGNDQNFIGFGERSLILSDFAAPYLFLKLNTKFGKRIRYQNIFSKFTDYSALLGNTLFTPKYGAFHRVSAKIGKGTFIGISEIVMFQREDSNQNGYDISYLNPIMFLRAAEINAGSNDNVMMALDFKQHTNFNTIFYGQFLLDEFNISQIRSNNGWWANKYGYQLGAKYVHTNSLVNMFSASLEYNRVRPYTYSHFNTGNSYAHFNQSLAHPLGANFDEIYTHINYVPNLKFMKNRDMLIIDFSSSIANKGVDEQGRNYGGNILVSNTSRYQDFGNTLLQGAKVNAMISNLTLSYRLGYASFFDLKIQHRSGSAYIGTGTAISLGYRLNAELSRTNWF